MANYRIKVERLNDDVPLSKELEDGVEVKGFAILADVDDERVLSVVQHMSCKDIACAMHGNDTFMHAAALSAMARMMIGGNHE